MVIKLDSSCRTTSMVFRYYNSAIINTESDHEVHMITTRIQFSKQNIKLRATPAFIKVFRLLSYWFWHRTVLEKYFADIYGIRRRNSSLTLITTCNITRYPYPSKNTHLISTVLTQFLSDMSKLRPGTYVCFQYWWLNTSSWVHFFRYKTIIKAIQEHSLCYRPI